jgi:hypothetical protein
MFLLTLSLPSKTQNASVEKIPLVNVTANVLPSKISPLMESQHAHAVYAPQAPALVRTYPAVMTILILGFH